MSSPQEFLKHIVGRRVIVKLNQEDVYSGSLSGLDGYLNVTLDDTVEESSKEKESFGKCFFRGNNGFFFFFKSSTCRAERIR